MRRSGKFRALPIELKAYCFIMHRSVQSNLNNRGITRTWNSGFLKSPTLLESRVNNPGDPYLTTVSWHKIAWMVNRKKLLKIREVPKTENAFRGRWFPDLYRTA